MTEELISKLTDFILCSGLSEEYTAEIKGIIEALKSGQKYWVARDEDGLLGAYKKRPGRYYGPAGIGYWDLDLDSETTEPITLSADLLPSLTWKDEPKEVILGLFVLDD